MPIVFLLACGIWSGLYLPFSLDWWVPVAIILCTLVSIFLFFRCSLILMFCCCAASLIGAVSMNRINRPVLPDHHISQFADGAKKTIVGQVDSLACHYPGKVRMTLNCKEIIDQNGRPHLVTGRVRVNIYLPGLSQKFNLPFFGDFIQFYSRLHGIRNFANPGGYDYKARMRYQGIFGTTHIRADKITIQTQSKTGIRVWFYRQIDAMRTGFWKRTQKLAGPEQAAAAGVLTALVTGKKEAVPAGVKEQFSQAGISHLLAISGFHLALIALGAYWILSRALILIPSWTISGRTRKAAGLLTLIPLTSYALFTGFSPSTQRALIMVTGFMVALSLEKQKDPLNIICLAAILILLFDPPSLFSISFQLSFAAVWCIIIGFARIHRMGWLPEHKGFAWLWGMVLVTFFAGLGTAPLIARYFNMLSCIQVASNLVLVPLIGFICLPLGIAGFLLGGWIWPWAGDWILLRVIHLLDMGLGVVAYLTGFDWAWVRVVTPGNIELLLIYSGIAAIYLTVFKRNKQTIGFLLAVVVASVIWVGYRLKQRYLPGRLTIINLDVGQASAAVIRTPNGKTVLIDGGGFSGRSMFDTGRFIIAPYLWRQWIMSLDAVILTHPQADHMNGLIFILKNFKVDQWIHNGDKNTSRSFHTLTDILYEKAILQVIPGPKGMDLLLDDVDIRILPGPSHPMDLNNNSLVSCIFYKQFSILFPGDVEAEREQMLVEVQDLPLAVDILVSPHHGSKSSSTHIFLDKVNAQEVIISCGYKNRFGFPSDRVLERYRHRGMNIFRTDLMGAVFVTSSGIGYNITTYRKH